MQEHKQQAYLITTNLSTGEKTKSCLYDKEMLTTWLKRARRESSEFVLKWEMFDKEDSE